MFLLNSDIEYLIITIFLAFLFLTGLKMRQYDNCNIRDFVMGGPLSSSKRQDPGQMSILIVMNMRDVKN